MGTKLGYLISNVKNEVKVIGKKISKVEQKTSSEIEKVVSLMVNKLLKDNAQSVVSEEVKNEIVQKLTSYNKGKNLLPIIKYVNKTILKNVPKNVNSAKSFKKNVVNTLIKDAEKRLEVTR